MTESTLLVQEIGHERDAFVDRMLQATAGVFDIFTIYIGDQLGLYQTLADMGPLNSSDLAKLTGTQERYIREWLEQQTVAGILQVENLEGDSSKRRFKLPDGHAEVLVEKDSLNYLAPLSQLVVGVTSPVRSVLDAYRNGGGVSLDEYGPDFRHGQALINRNTFLEELGQIWLPAVPGLVEYLETTPAARIADIGCGAGWSSIALARRFPNIFVDGFDLDEPSINMARANAVESGLNGNLNFYVRDAGDPDLTGRYDLVTAFECIHDLSDPVSVLSSMRRIVKDDGEVIVADERVGDSFTASGNDVEWMMYGWSVLHCLPVGMAEQPSAGTGTVMRSDTLREYALQAGFSDVEILPVDNFFFRIYRLIP